MAATLEAAKAYLQAYCLNTAAWDAADDPTKTKALNQAINEIARLPWLATAPAANKDNATYEQAAFLLELRANGGAERANLQAQGVASASVYAGASESYGKGNPANSGPGFILASGARKWTLGYLQVVADLA